MFLIAAAFAGAPAIPEGAVLTPTFSLTDGLRWTAGTAFVAETDSGPALVSALHLFGPAAGLRYQLSLQEVRQRGAVQAVDRQTGRKAAVSSDALLLSGADASKDDPTVDVVAFRLAVDKKGRAGGRMPVAPLRVAEACPDVGSLVWVPGNRLDAAQGIAAFEARVERCDDRTITFRYSAAGLDFAGTSGAPLLDASGVVRGMVWGGSQEGGVTVGVAMSAQTLGAHLFHRPLPAAAPPPPPPSPWGTIATGWDPVPNPWGYDLPGLHARLLPDWGISGAKDDVLKAGLATSDIGPIFAEIARLSWADNSGNFPRIVELMHRWDALYRERGIPLRMNAGARGQTLAWMTWHVDATATVHLAGKGIAVDIVRRMDRLNVADSVPTLLTGDEGVVVPLDDLRDDQLYPLWRRLDPAAKDPLAAALSTELTTAIGADAVATLKRTAPLRRELDSVRDAISKRSSCSRYGVSRLPWWGLSPDLDAALAAQAVPSGRCPPITTSELDRLRKATAALAAESGLEASLEALQAHLARSVAIEGAAMRLACTECGWEGRVGPGAMAALSDPPTRVAAAARLCTRAEVDRALDTYLDGLGACSGKDLSGVLVNRWPLGWGPLSIEGVPTSLSVRAPRDAADQPPG